MTYELVFDIAKAGCRADWMGAIAAVSIVISVTGAILWRKLGRIPINTGGTMPTGAFLALFFGVAGMISGFMFSTSYADYVELRDALREGRAEVVEGPVTNLGETGIQNHHGVSFAVGTTKFSYSQSSIDQNGYHQLLSDGSPLRERLPVRIHHLRGQIARLELVKP